MTQPDVGTTIWDDPRNVETLIALQRDGLSYGQIAAAIGQGVTRNACIGKAKRLGLPPRVSPLAENRHHARTINGRAAHRGARGGARQAKANSILHRIEGRHKIEPLRIDMEAGVDVAHLIAFDARRIGQQCAWIPGDPLDGAMCCGKPVKEGSQWCPDHYARVYSGRAAL